MVIMVHGLNVNPASLLPIKNWFEEKFHARVETLALAGHESYELDLKVLPENPLDLKKLWQEQLSEKIESLAQSQKDKNLILLGHSLGGAIISSYLLSSLPSENNWRSRKAILLAPALCFPWPLRASLSALRFFANFFAINYPSFSSSKIRRRSYTPALFYLALSSVVEEVLKSQKLPTIPVLLMGHEKDELVDMDCGRKILEKKFKTLNSVIFSHPLARSGDRYHTLMGPETVGEQYWFLWSNEIKDFLLSSD